MGNKQYALKSNDVALVGPNTAFPTAPALTSARSFNINIQGYTGFIVQMNYTYGAATGLVFSFTEFDSDGGSFGTPGSVVTKIDTSSGIAAPYTVTYNYPSLASGSVRLVFPISGDTIRMTVTAVGTATGSDTITALVAIPCVLV